MKDLLEYSIGAALAFCGIALCYWIMGEWLIALVEQSLASIRP